MNAIHDAVQALHESFELTPLPQFDGHITFLIDGMGRLDLEECGEALLVSLSRELSTSDDRIAVQRAALQAVHYKNQSRPPVQASMHNDTLVFSARLDAAEVDVPTIDHALQQMHSLHEQARS